MNQQRTLLNFAYGSNMLIRRIRERVPSARAIAVGTLFEHELRWHKVSKDGSGKCDVLPVRGTLAPVLGVIYEIAAAEKPQLDQAEGLGNGYEEKEVDVQTTNGPTKASMYFATHIDPNFVPFTWYKALVVGGAREHGLPPHYVATLEAVAANADPNSARAKNHFDMLAKPAA